MKKQAAVLLVFALAVALIPAAAAYFGGMSGESVDPLPEKAAETLTLLDEATGNKIELSMREYLLGALACEMPVSYEDEALKAQAVALHTYALYLKEHSDKDYAFAIDSSARGGYMDESARKSLFGVNYPASEQKIEQAVDSTFLYILTYSGEPIVASFHAISPGKTEDSGNVFSTSMPYLVPADCADDVSSAGYLSSAEFAPGELSDLMRIFDAQFAAAGEPETWIGAIKRSESGTVLSMEICGRTYTGPDVRRALGLRSAAFTPAYTNEKFVFEVKGYGHGVGMSQNEANELAKKGETFDAILAYFYKGTTLSKSA